MKYIYAPTAMRGGDVTVVYSPTDEEWSAFLGEVDCGQIGWIWGGRLIPAEVGDYEPVEGEMCIWADDWPLLGGEK